MARNPRHMWAVFDAEGQLCAPTVSRTRDVAICSFVYARFWKTAFRQGCRCRKVTVVDGWRDVAKEGE